MTAASGDIDSFYQMHIPVPSSRDVPLVIEVDGKGVVMRPEALRPATQRARLAAEVAHRSRLTPGEKPNRKRMATVACAFDAVPAPRRPHDVIHPPGGRSTRRRIRRGPAATRKWCTASLLHPPEKVIADVFAQAEARDPGHHRCWVVLVDGARHQLDLIHREAARRRCTINVLLDFVHVTEYVWTAAHAFYKPGTTEADAWVTGHLTTLLAGQTDRAAQETTTQADRAGLRAGRREAVEACRRYLTGHLDQLRYDIALASGWPITTGEIEGACRQ